MSQILACEGLTATASRVLIPLLFDIIIIFCPGRILDDTARMYVEMVGDGDWIRIVSPLD